MDFRSGDFRASVGLLILRLGAGGYLASHGWGKVRMVFAGEFAQMGDPIGIGSVPSLLLVAFAEFVCSILVMVGLFTRWAALPPAFAMAVAAFVAHGSDPWSMETGAKAFIAGTSKTWASKEPALLFLFPFLALSLTGAGGFSIDGWFRSRRPTG